MQTRYVVPDDSLIQELKQEEVTKEIVKLKLGDWRQEARKMKIESDLAELYEKVFSTIPSEDKEEEHHAL